MQSRRQNEIQPSPVNPTSFEIAYLKDTRKISGFECRKAIIISSRSNGKKDSIIVWYAPDIKLQGLSSTGGSFAGFGGFGPQASTLIGMDKLEGFPIQYERNMNRGRKMTVQVTKIVSDKEITDLEFEIPKGTELKSTKDMQGMMGGPGGGFQMRIGG